MKHRNYLTDKRETLRTKYILMFLSRGMHSTEARRMADAAVLIAGIMAIRLSMYLKSELFGLNYGNTLGVE
ncbi:MAG: hypothetical protein IKA93_01015 [Elusimicrobiaceae bacterium]|nr:hypothetical protein [Elusimicrobiaceae bacterium]